MRIHLLAFAFLAISAPAVAIQDPTAETTQIVFGGPETVVIETAEGSTEFAAELAQTPEQQTRGLMWRDSLAGDAGMLFHYEPTRPASIWMLNTQIALDILYIAEDGTVVKLIAHAQPGSRRSLTSDFPVAGVLEIAAGRATELGIRPGAIVRHRFFQTEAESDATGASSADSGDE